jgi:hypothetical protein
MNILNIQILVIFKNLEKGDFLGSQKDVDSEMYQSEILSMNRQEQEF